MGFTAFGAQTMRAPTSLQWTIYKPRDKVEGLYRRWKRFRLILSRSENLDVLLIACMDFALVIEAMRSVHTLH
jgi:hypothetical protein